MKPWRFEDSQENRRSWRFEDGGDTICRVTKSILDEWAYRCRWEGCEDLVSGGWSNQRFAYAAARQHAKAHIRSLKFPMVYSDTKISESERVS